MQSWYSRRRSMSRSRSRSPSPTRTRCEERYPVPPPPPVSFEAERPAHGVYSLPMPVSIHPAGPRPRSPEIVDVEDAYEETLPAGNYLMCAWDVLVDDDQDVCQIGAFLPHGDRFNVYVSPQSEKDMNILPYTQVNDAWFVRLPHTRQMMPCQVIDVALRQFLEFLEKGKSRSRPDFDGVLLLSYAQEAIPVLLKAMTKRGLVSRFRGVVKGMGDLSTYLAKKHAKKFMENGNMDLKLKTVYNKIVQQNLGPYATKDRTSEATFHILQKLLNDNPSYANFMAKNVHPLKSKFVTRLATMKTIQERLDDDYAPLFNDVVQRLAPREGVNPRKVASATCRMLLDSGIHLAQLLDVYQSRGIQDVEYMLRRAFLRQTTEFSKDSVHQTVQTTKLVVSFCRDKGHRSLASLVAKGQAVTRPAQDPSPDLLRPLLEYLKSSPSKGQCEAAESMVGAVAKAGITLDRLGQMFEESGADRKAFEDGLPNVLLDAFAIQCPHIDYDLFVDSLFLFSRHRVPSSKRDAAPSDQETRRFDSQQMMADAHLKQCGEVLRTRIRHAANLAAHNAKASSLRSLKGYIYDKYLPVLSLGNPQMGPKRASDMSEHLTAMLAFFDFSHFRLQSLVESGASRIADALRICVNNPINKRMWPKSIQVDWLAKVIVECYQNSNS